MNAADVIAQIRRLPQQEQLRVLEVLRLELQPHARSNGPCMAQEDRSPPEGGNTTPLEIATRLADEAFERHASLFRRLAQ